MSFKYSTDLRPKQNVDFPDGEYEFRVLTAEEKLTKALPQRNMLVLDIEIFHPVYMSSSIFIKEYFVEDSNYIEQKMDRFFKCVGKPEMFGGVNEYYEFNGLTGKCSIKFENKEKYAGYRIDKYLQKEDVSLKEVSSSEEIQDEQIPF